MEMFALDGREASFCNMDYLLDSLAGNRAMAEKLAGLYLDSYPNLVLALDQALDGSDLVALRKIVHNIRGSCAMFSAEPCLALAGKLEGELPDRSGPDLVADCTRLREVLDSMAQELARFLDGH